MWSKTLLSVGIAIIVALIGYWRIPAGTPHDFPPFSGGPQFAILSFVTAIALYLRQVNLAAIQARYDIRHGKSWNRPPELKYRRQRIDRLEQTSTAIALVSPYLFFMIVGVSYRIMYEAYARFWFVAAKDEKAPRELFVFDAVISAWLLAGMAGLAIAHFRVRYADEVLLKKVLADPAESVRVQESLDEDNKATRPEEKKATA